MRFENGDLIVWSEDLWPKGRIERDGACRFSPNCEDGRGEGRPSHEGCPNASAAFAERMGGESLAGYERWTPLCQARAEARWGPEAVRRVSDGD